MDERDPKTGATLLFFCAEGEKLDLLLDAGADVDARDFRGNTSLINRVNSNHVNAAQRLLDRGASADLIGDAGCTVLSSVAGL